MGFREAALFRFVLLLLGGTLRAATQNWSNLSTNETRIPQERVLTSFQSAGLQETQMKTQIETHVETSGPARSPLTYRLKTYQLRREKTLRSEASRLTSEQLEPGVTVQAQELVRLVQGPNLNPPVQQEPKVLTLVFDQRVPEPAASVAARCGEGEVIVEVKQNFLGNGQLIRPTDLTLGGCAALDAAPHVLQFQTRLQGCGGTARMTEEAIIYSFSLMYSPTPIGNTYILKTSPAEVVIECHYLRRHYVSAVGGARPTWTPFASKVSAEQQLNFSLRLMTEDWRSPRPSGVYFLGDVMHMEAAVLRGDHVPLRVYVDDCVASVGPDPDSQPRYAFISNHGCLSDAKLTGAKSYFMQRSQEDKLHFQLKAFKFHKHHSNSLYITCRLKATRASVPINTQHKVCSFLTEANRWVASGGDNEVCSCCDTSCGGQRKGRSLAHDADVQWEETLALGPLLVEELPQLLVMEEVPLEELLVVEEVPVEELPQLQTHEVTQAASRPSSASRPSTVLLCGAAAAPALLLLLLLIAAIIHSRQHKPAGHFVCT